MNLYDLRQKQFVSERIILLKEKDINANSFIYTNHVNVDLYNKYSLQIKLLNPDNTTGITVNVEESDDGENFYEVFDQHLMDIFKITLSKTLPVTPSSANKSTAVSISDSNNSARYIRLKITNLGTNVAKVYASIILTDKYNLQY